MQDESPSGLEVEQIGIAGNDHVDATGQSHCEDFIVIRVAANGRGERRGCYDFSKCLDVGQC